jgi:hypothetical protein
LEIAQYQAGKDFPKVRIIMQEKIPGAYPNELIFGFLNTGIHDCKNARVAFEFVRIQAGQKLQRINPEPELISVGTLENDEPRFYSRSMPEPRGDLYALATFSSTQDKLGAVHTNKSWAVIYNFGGRWFIYKEQSTALGERERKQIDEEILWLNQKNISQKLAPVVQY